MAGFEDIPIEKRFDDLCNELKINDTIQEDAWEKYKEVWNSYSLDGDNLQWLVCALYECFQKFSANEQYEDPSVAHVSLHKLINAAKMNYVQFFYRIKKWSEMVEMSEALRDRIEILERQFAVASVLYNKYKPIFASVFQYSESSQSKSAATEEALTSDIAADEDIKPGDEAAAKRGKKAAGGNGGRAGKTPQKPCTPQELYKFVWLLFVQARANFPAVCDDLVNSFHLLICVVEFVYSNAIAAHRKDILNFAFPATEKLLQAPPSVSTAAAAGGGAGAAATPRSVASLKEERTELALRRLCEIHGCQFVHCKTLTDQHIRPHFKRLIEKDYLKGRHLTLTGILDAANFHVSYRMLNSLYDDWVRYAGAFDERLLLLSAEVRLRVIGSGRDHLRVAKVKPAPILTSRIAPIARRYMEKRASVLHVATTIPDSPEKRRRLRTSMSAQSQPTEEKMETSEFDSMTLFSQEDKQTAVVMQRVCASVHLSTQEERNHCLQHLQQLLVTHDSSHQHAEVDLETTATIPPPGFDSFKQLLITYNVIPSPTTEVSKQEDTEAEEAPLEISSGDNDILNQITIKQREFGDAFCQCYVQEHLQAIALDESLGEEELNLEQRTQMAWEDSVQRLTLIQSLHFLVMERIVMDELNKVDRRETPGPASEQTTTKRNELILGLQQLLVRDSFQRGLFAVCAEIVLRLCYNPHESPVSTALTYPFPWILYSLQLSAYHMYKLLQLVSSTMQSDFPRELIRYMNALAEHVVDSLAWRHNSPLWKVLRARESNEHTGLSAVPKVVDVMPLDMFEKPKASSNRSTVMKSETASGHQITFSMGESPIKAAQAAAAAAASAANAPGTPMGSGANASTGKLLTSADSTGNPNTSPVRIQSQVGPRAKQLLQIVRGGPSNQSGTSGVVKSYSGLPITQQPADVFFRHLYYVCSCRLRDLCERLTVNRDLMQRAWTCLELCLREHTHLMCDRNVDTLMICSLFAIHRISPSKTLSMLDIIQAYRIQPHSHRDVYRSIVMDSTPGEDVSQMIPRSYGDIIHFYNHIFLPHMNSTVRKFMSNVLGFSGHLSSLMRQGGAIGPAGYTMSPLPMKQSDLKIGNQFNSRRVVNGRNVFVSPVKSSGGGFMVPGGQVAMSPKRIIFSMQQSPSKDLREINTMLYNHERKAMLNTNMNVGLKRMLHSPATGIHTSQGGHFASPAPLGRFDSGPASKRMNYDM